MTGDELALEEVRRKLEDATELGRELMEELDNADKWLEVKDGRKLAEKLELLSMVLISHAATEV